jgi:hypothetical protein
MSPRTVIFFNQPRAGNILPPTYRWSRACLLRRSEHTRRLRPGGERRGEEAASQGAEERSPIQYGPLAVRVV